MTPASASQVDDVPTGPSRAWPVEALLAPGVRYAAVLIIAVSFVFPLGGLGFDLCWLHATTGLPCPGCGLSRAVSAISQGDFSAALGLNPFAFFAWPTFFGLAVLALLPGASRQRVEAALRRSGRLGQVLELSFWAFLGFGVIRFGIFLALAERFP